MTLTVAEGSRERKGKKIKGLNGEGKGGERGRRYHRRLDATRRPECPGDCTLLPPAPLHTGGEGGADPAAGAAVSQGESPLNCELITFTTWKGGEGGVFGMGGYGSFSSLAEALNFTALFSSRPLSLHFSHSPGECELEAETILNCAKETWTEIS